MHTGARARKQKHVSIYISLYMKTFLKTGVYIYIYIYIFFFFFFFLTNISEGMAFFPQGVAYREQGLVIEP